MSDFNIRVIPIINQTEEIGEKQLSVFGSRGGQIGPLMQGKNKTRQRIKPRNTVQFRIQSHNKQ